MLSADKSFANIVVFIYIYFALWISVANEINVNEWGIYTYMSLQFVISLNEGCCVCNKRCEYSFCTFVETLINWSSLITEFHN